MHLRFQVGSVVRIAAVRAKPQTFTFKMLPNTSTPSSCSKKPLVYSFKSNPCSLNHNNRLLIGRGSAKLSSKPKANRSEGRSSQLLLAFFFFFWESVLHFLVPRPPPPRRDRNCALGPQQTPESVRAQGRRSSRPGDARPLQGEPLSVKCHQSQPRPHHFGPNGIDRPSLDRVFQAGAGEKG